MATRILALDTATEACSVAIWNEGEITSVFEHCHREHTQRILPLIQQLLAQSGLTLSQLDALAYGCGPGSFTGVRIGIGIAQGLALGADLPMIGISTLKTLAQGAYRANAITRVLSAIDARMEEVYWGEYLYQGEGDWLLNQPETLLSPSQMATRLADLSGQWTYAGTGWQTYPPATDRASIKLTDSNLLLPQAQDMLPCALHDWKTKKAVAVEHAQPVYLRNEVAWKKLPGR